MHVRERIRNFYRTFLSLQGEPHELARATALGVFIGASPTIPLHTASILVLCLLLRQNITAAMLSATVVSNPVTIPVLYFAEYEIGRLLLGLSGNPFALESYDARSILELGWNILYPLLVGGFLLSLAFAIPSYFLALRALRRLRGRNGRSPQPAA